MLFVNNDFSIYSLLAYAHIEAYLFDNAFEWFVVSDVAREIIVRIYLPINLNLAVVHFVDDAHQRVQPYFGELILLRLKVDILRILQRHLLCEVIVSDFLMRLHSHSLSTVFCLKLHPPVEESNFAFRPFVFFDAKASAFHLNHCFINKYFKGATLSLPYLKD